jgi:KaiC/GvpD/RAD55 family RecA-like ATPase
MDNGYEGVYVSFQRPEKNVSSLFKQYGIDSENVVIVDCVTSNDEVEKKSDFSNNYSSMDLDALSQTISESLKGLKSEKKFILIDSLTTLALYKSSYDITRLSEMLIDIIRENTNENSVLLFNVAEDLRDKEFIKDIVLHTDEVINVLNSANQYSRNIVGSNYLT